MKYDSCKNVDGPDCVCVRSPGTGGFSFGSAHFLFIVPRSFLPLAHSFFFIYYSSAWPASAMPCGRTEAKRQLLMKSRPKQTVRDLCWQITKYSTAHR